MEKSKVLLQIYLLLDDIVNNKDNYQLFKKVFIEERKITYKEIIDHHYITNIWWWKNKMQSYLNNMECVDCNDILKVIFEIITKN